MPAVLACVDGSDYDASVCEYAVWLAGAIDARVEILCAPADELPQSPAAIERDAFERLLDLGAPHLKRLEVDIPLTQAVRASGADLAVMGKRGVSDDEDRSALGSNAAAVVAQCDLPVCLASRVFLPVRRAMLLLDDEPGRRVAIDFLLSRPGLQDLVFDVVVVSGDAKTAGAKAAAARRWLRGRQASVTQVQAQNLTDALDRCMNGRAADIFVISRAVLFPDDDGRRRQLQSCGLWTWRSPVLVC